MRRAIGSAMALLLSLPLLAGTITGLNPSSIKHASGEHFMAVSGTGFSASDEFVIDGPAGHFELTVNAIDAAGTITGWIPLEVVMKTGLYNLVVRSANGDSAPQSFSITKPGRLPLKIHLPELIAALARSPLGTGIKYEVLTSGGDGSDVTINCDPQSGSTFPYGTSKISCVAANLGGERDDATVQVNVWDGTAPELKLPEGFEVAAEDEKGAYVKFEAYATDDIDGSVRVVCDRDSGALFPNGRTRVTCEAVDVALNYGYGSFDVFVHPRDPGVLEIRTPVDLKVEATDKEGAHVAYEVTTYGSADPDPVVECFPPSESYFRIGETKVGCTAWDDFGARAEATFLVHVVEASGLRSENITAEATSPDGAEVNWDARRSNQWTVLCSPESGSWFALGETNVECSGTNVAGEKETGSFKVTIEDTIAPHIENVRAVVGQLDRERGVTPVNVEVETIDAGDAAPRCSVTTVDGDLPIDWARTSELSFEIGAGAPRAFRAQVSCVDAAGNRATTNIPLSLGKGRPAKVN